MRRAAARTTTYPPYFSEKLFTTLDKLLFPCYIVTMKTTKGHFKFVAALISAARNGVPADALATLAAAKFAKDNPRFDSDRFKRACGLTWGEIENPTAATVSDTGVVAWAADQS